MRQAADDVQRALNEVTGLKDRIVLLDNTLSENMTEALGSLDARIEDMAQGMDIATILNGLAAEAGSA